MGEGRLPGEGRDSQPTVLVSGEHRDLLRKVPLELLAKRAREGDGVVIVATRRDPAAVERELCAAVDVLDDRDVALVDCCPKGTDSLAREGFRWQVPSPASFEHTTTAIEEALDALDGRGVDRIHFLFDTLATPLRTVDTGAVLEHAHDIAMTVGAERGLGIFTVEPTMVTDEEFDRLKHLLDVHVELRRSSSDAELRWTGLLDSSEGWIPLTEAGNGFDMLGKGLG